MNPLRLLLLLAVLALMVPAAAVSGPPAATTSPATSVTSGSATLNGTVFANQEETTWYFEYGTTTAYGSKTPDQVTPGANSGKDVSADIGGLQPGTVYHFRLVAKNPSNPTGSFGNDVTFTTAGSPYVIPPPPPAPARTITIARAPTIIVFGRTTVISGVVGGQNCANVQVQLLSAPFPYTGGFKPDGAPVNTGADCRYSFTRAPGLHTRYMTTARTGGPQVGSGIVEVRVRTRVGFSVSDSRVDRGQLVRFRGTVAPAHNGRTVNIQRRTSTGRFRTIVRTRLRATTGGRSKYSRRIRITRRGVYRVIMRGHNDHLQGTSRRRTISLN